MGMVGDHIRALRGSRWAHAIDCGDETVILLADDPARTPARVRRGYRPDFVAGASAVEVVTHRERTFPAEEVVARAYSRITDPALASMFRDSEAFAEWCTTGRLPAGPPAASPSAAPPPAPAPARGAARPRGRAARKAPSRRAAPPRREARRASPARRGAGKKPARAPARKGAGKKRAKAGGGKRAPRRGARR
jgi:hypothetical protein